MSKLTTGFFFPVTIFKSNVQCVCNDGDLIACFLHYGIFSKSCLNNRWCGLKCFFPLHNVTWHIMCFCSFVNFCSRLVASAFLKFPFCYLVSYVLHNFHSRGQSSTVVTALWSFQSSSRETLLNTNMQDKGQRANVFLTTAGWCFLHFDFFFLVKLCSHREALLWQVVLGLHRGLLGCRMDWRVMRSRWVFQARCHQGQIDIVHVGHDQHFLWGSDK